MALNESGGGARNAAGRTADRDALVGWAVLFAKGNG
jgi:hypothetical protein